MTDRRQRPKVQPFERLARAERLAAEGRVDRALWEVEAVTKHHPDLFEAWHLKGVLALFRGRTERAVEALRRAVTLAPEDATCWTNLGIAEHRAGQPDDAEQSLRRAIELRPGLAQAHHNLAVVQRDRGELDAALESLRQAVARDPDYAKAWLELGRLHRLRDALDDALASLARAAELPDACEEAGQIEQARGRYGAAAGHYEACLRRDPARTTTRLTLGFCLQEDGRLDDALDQYRQALAADPDLYPLAVKSLTTASKGALWQSPAELRSVLLDPEALSGRPSGADAEKRTRARTLSPWSG
jgi:tetratricopeptide (TPR) repeat protein